MKRILTMAVLALCVGFTACQTYTWKIQGVCDDMQDGDTLYLISDLRTSIPRDTAVVTNGKFEFVGDDDSLTFCVIASNEAVLGNLFIEKGRIDVVLSKNADSCKVGGTFANDQLQLLSTQLALDGQDMVKVSTTITNQVRENIDNEYGYFLLTYFDDGTTISTKDRKDLIDMLPQTMRERQAIQRLAARTEKELSVAEGATIENFTMNDINGKPVSIYDELKGKKLLILDFWASWCSPCRAEMPRLVELYAKYKSKGLGVVGISLDKDADAWKKETQRLGITWTQLSDLKYWNNEVAQMFVVQSIPHMIVVDEKGMILKRGLRGESLEQFVAAYLNE